MGGFSNPPEYQIGHNALQNMPGAQDSQSRSRESAALDRIGSASRGLEGLGLSSSRGATSTGSTGMGGGGVGGRGLEGLGLGDALVEDQFGVRVACEQPRYTGSSVERDIASLTAGTCAKSDFEFDRFPSKGSSSFHPSYFLHSCPRFLLGILFLFTGSN